MSEILPFDDAGRVAAHLTREERLRRAVDLATQFEEILRQIDCRHSIRYFRPSDLTERAILEKVYSLEDVLNKKLRAMDEQRNTVLSPISRLNGDCLRHIFGYLCREDFVDLLSPWCDIGMNVVLSHVCRQWMTVILDMAPVWVEVRLRLQSPVYTDHDLSPWDAAPGSEHRFFTSRRDQDPSMSQSRQLKAFLQRSKSSPLRAGLNFTNGSGALLKQHFIELCGGRAEIVWVDFSSQAANNLSPCLSSVSAVLKELHVRQSFADAGPLAEELKNVLRLHMPSLRRVELQGVPTPSVFHPGYIGFSHLTMLEWRNVAKDDDSFTIATLRTILQCCPDLETLSISTDMDKRGAQRHIVPYVHVENQRVSMRNLKSYSVFLELDLFPIAFDTLHAPQLSNMRFSLYMPTGHTLNPELQAGQDLSGQAICNFLRLCSSDLRSISMSGLQPSSCERILEMTRTIETVEYHQWTYDRGERWERIWERAMPSNCQDRNELLCPSLEDLAYGGCYDTRQLEAFYELIQERAKPLPRHFGSVGRIRRLALSHSPIGPSGPRRLEARIAAATEEFHMGKWSYNKVDSRWVERETAHIIRSSRGISRFR